MRDVDMTLVVLDPEAQGVKEGWVHVLASIFPDATILVALCGRQRGALARAALGLPSNTQALVVPGSADAALATAYRAALATRPGSDVVRLTALRHPVDAVEPVARELTEHDVVVLSAGEGTNTSKMIKEATGGRVEVGSYDFQGISHHVLPDLVALIESGDVDAAILVNSVKNGEVPLVLSNRWKRGELLAAPKPAPVVPQEVPSSTASAEEASFPDPGGTSTPLPEPPEELLSGDALAAAFLEAPAFEDEGLLVPPPADASAPALDPLEAPEGVPAGPAPEEPGRVERRAAEVPVPGPQTPVRDLASFVAEAF
jgi:hypothetical protein